MTGKELMYLEDALGHEQYLLSRCCEASKSLQDSTLKNTVDTLHTQHQQLYSGFLTQLN